MDQTARPPWCSHADCSTLLCVSEQMICGGRLPKPEAHGADKNTHRFCLKGAADDGGVFDLQVNRGDLYWFSMALDAIRRDAKKD